MSARRKDRAEEERKEVLPVEEEEEEEEERQQRNDDADEEEDEEEEEDEDEGLEEAMMEAACSASSRRRAGLLQRQVFPRIPEAVDDFLRNFLRRAGLSRTLSNFEAEWYGSAHARLTDALTGVRFIPDALTHGQLLRNALQAARREAALRRHKVLEAGEKMARMQRERDFHRLQHRRVCEDKHRLREDIKQLRRHLEDCEPALRQLEDKYQAALTQKMLISLGKDRVQDNAEEKEKEKVETEGSLAATRSPAERRARHPKDARFPAPGRLVKRLPVQVHSEKWKSPSSFRLTCSIRAHRLPISSIDLHPRKRILASASDDRSWRLWALPAGGEKVGEEGGQWVEGSGVR